MARTLTLLGPDVLLVAMGGARANNAVLVTECGGGVSAARVESALDLLLPIAPYMSSRLERPFPWGRLRWRTVDGRPPVVSKRLTRDERIEAVVDEALNETIDARREPPLRWIVVHSHDGAHSWLLLVWVHPLMDPRGAELLVTMLDAVDRGGDARAWATRQLVEAPKESHDRRTAGRLARLSLATLRGFGREPPRPLGRGIAKPGRVRHRRLVAPAVSRPLPVTLAAVGRAMAALWRERGFALDQPYLVPISVDRRRKGEAGPVFGNFVSFHFVRFTPAAAAADVRTTAAAIRRDMAEAVRADAVEGVWLGMSFARYYPAGKLLRPFGGEGLASFYCADTGEVRPTLTSLLGVPVRAAYHVPCVQPRPGLGVFFSRLGDEESIVAVWVDGVVTEAEVDCVLDAVRSSVGATLAA